MQVLKAFGLSLRAGLSHRPAGNLGGPLPSRLGFPICTMNRQDKATSKPLAATAMFCSSTFSLPAAAQPAALEHSARQHQCHVWFLHFPPSSSEAPAGPQAALLLISPA